MGSDFRVNFYWRAAEADNNGVIDPKKFIKYGGIGRERKMDKESGKEAVKNIEKWAAAAATNTKIPNELYPKFDGPAGWSAGDHRRSGSNSR